MATVDTTICDDTCDTTTDVNYLTIPPCDYIISKWKLHTSAVTAAFNRCLDRWGWASGSGSSTTTSYATTSYAHVGVEMKYGYDDCRYEPYKPSIREKMRDILSSRMAPAILVPRKYISKPVDEREFRARQTLRMVVGEERYLRFLKHGFVSVKNPQSGRTYQIFPGHGFTCVWENGQLIQKLCVVLSGNFVPTDNLIVRFMMAVNNETRLWELANKHTPAKTSQKIVYKPEMRSLVQIFADMKKVA